MSTAVFLARSAGAAVLSAGVALMAGAGTAVADAVPGCWASDITAAEAQAATGMTAYLVTHPEVNEFFSGLQGLPSAEIARRTITYLNANPQIQNELDGVRAPVFDLRDRCGIPYDTIIGGVL